MDLIKQTTAWLLLLIGLLACLLGLAIGGVEAYHIFTNVHNFEYPPFIGAAAFLISGAALIQTKNVNDVLSILLSTLRVGGRRKFDPPATDENEVLKP